MHGAEGASSLRSLEQEEVARAEGGYTKSITVPQSSTARQDQARSSGVVGVHRRLAGDARSQTESRVEVPGEAAAL